MSSALHFSPETRSLTLGGWTIAGPLVHVPDGDTLRTLLTSYSSWADGTGIAEVEIGDALVRFTDQWTWREPILRLERSVEVLRGGDGGGYCTEARVARDDAAAAQLFLPGTQYGDPARANPAAIGGQQAREYGDRAFYIREDRLPAPLGALRLPDGATIAVLDAEPDGRTTPHDAAHTGFDDDIDAGCRVGAISVADVGALHLGYVFPAVEGPTSYTGDTFPDGQTRAWRRRFHPLSEGSGSRYVVEWRFGAESTMQSLVSSTWRWAWDVLKPAVDRQDIAAARAALFDQLADSVLEVDGRAGFPHFRDAVSGKPYQPPHRQADHALMGFTGRSTDCAYYLLRESWRIDDDAVAKRYRRLAEKVLDSFAAMPIDPPAGEGFDIRTGELVPAAPHQARADVMLLRGLAEGGKSMLRAWREARQHGSAKDEWLRWGLGLADWIAGQQRPDGSVPRAWLLGTTEVTDPSGYSSYNAVSLLAEAFSATADPRYRDAAVRAGEYCWRSGQEHGVFVGGTLDNPDVIDKEAGTLSLEAYLSLYDATGDRVWIPRAQAAAGYAETWIYIWDVPMPEGTAQGRGWKPGVTTVGAQLIASGHSLVDQYMAFDAGNYARLFALTGDVHYREVAELLLHNTKTMLSVPDHPFDLAGPGWQQEHWSFAPARGEGLHRGWLPWVTCSHIEGIVILEERAPELLSSK